MVAAEYQAESCFLVTTVLATTNNVVENIPIWRFLLVFWRFLSLSGLVTQIITIVFKFKFYQPKLNGGGKVVCKKLVDKKNKKKKKKKSRTFCRWKRRIIVFVMTRWTKITIINVSTFFCMRKILKKRNNQFIQNVILDSITKK